MTTTAVGTVPPASRTRLAIATVIALIVAGIVLIVAVLPAEYGIDPLGIGQRTGLLALYEAGAGVTSPGAAVITPDPSGPLVASPARYKVDTMSFTLAPGQAIEYKYQLATGATMVYTWAASGEVEFDFHTEPEGKGAAGSESFEKGEAATGNGSYRARYPGIHGWYWHNTTRDEVTVRLTTAGFYTEAKQFLMDGTSRSRYLDDVPVAR